MSILYTFNSTKDAVNGVKICESNGVKLSICAIPSDISSECGIAFKVQDSESQNIDQLLNSIKITPIKYER